MVFALLINFWKIFYFLGYVWWLFIYGIVLMIWFYLLNEFEIFGYEVFVVIIFLFIFIGISVVFYFFGIIYGIVFWRVFFLVGVVFF